MSFLFRAIFKPFSVFNPVEATVISFVLASLLGGTLLWYTESGRTIHAKQAALYEVTVVPSGEAGASAVLPDRFTEQHTYSKDVEYKGERWIDMVFTAVSALCVTGLTSTDFSHFTLLGQVITMILIQIGGLGVIMFGSILALVIIRGLSEKDNFRTIMSSILDTQHNEVGHMIRHVVLYTALVEGLSFLIMGVWLQWFSDPKLLIMNGVQLNAWWWALFHSVSAFNNAGFSLMSNNLVNYVTDPVINLVIAAEIIIGGLGYPVLVYFHAKAHRYIYGSTRAQADLDYSQASFIASPVQTRVAIGGTVLLLALGTLIPLLTDWSNPAMENLSATQKFLAMFFQSTSTRTAGFNTIDIGALTTATLFLYMLLMYIGANPAGTAGGIKIPTVAVLYAYLKDWFQKPGQAPRLFGRGISKFAISHAVRLFFFSILFIGAVTYLICVAESAFLRTPDPTFNFTKVLFEIFSAFGTVGLSMGFPGGVTSFSAILSDFSKWMIIFTMLFGRLGPLTILGALPWKRRYADAPPSNDFPGVQKIQIG